MLATKDELDADLDTQRDAWNSIGTLSSASDISAETKLAAAQHVPTQLKPEFSTDKVGPAVVSPVPGGRVEMHWPRENLF